MLRSGHWITEIGWVRLTVELRDERTEALLVLLNYPVGSMKQLQLVLHNCFSAYVVWLDMEYTAGYACPAHPYIWNKIGVASPTAAPAANPKTQSNSIIQNKVSMVVLSWYTAQTPMHPMRSVIPEKTVRMMVIPYWLLMAST